MKDQTNGIVEYDPIERTLQEFRAKYGDRAFDVSTPDGFADAKAVAKEGRKALTELEKIRKRIKDPPLRLCQRIDADAKRLASGIGAIFDPLFRAVDAEEKRQEQAREEAARQEALRVAKIRERMERLDPAIPFDADSVAIVALLNYVRANPVDESFQEFEDDAFLIRVAALDRLQAALDVVQAREREAADHAAAMEAERAESARLRELVEAQERNAAAAAAAASASGQLFPVEQSTAAFCRSCLRPLPPAATACVCGWTMLPDNAGSWIPTNFATPELNAAAREAAADYGRELGTIANGMMSRALVEGAGGELVQVDVRVPAEVANGADGRPPLSAPGALLDRMRGIDGRDSVPGAADLPASCRNAPTAATDQIRPVPLDVFDDRANDCVRICGVVYSGDFFRMMAAAPMYGWVRIRAREDVHFDAIVAPDDLLSDIDEMVDAWHRGRLCREGGQE